MKKIVLTFGLISAALTTVTMLSTVPFVNSGNLGSSEILGYTSIVLSSLLVFFGVRRYREHAGGTLTFGRGFLVGLLITLVSCTSYVIVWEIVYFTFIPGFGAKYAACMIDQAKASGASPQKIDETIRFAQRFQELYEIPIYNVLMTFAEPFPIGLGAALISAGVLRKRGS